MIESKKKKKRKESENIRKDFLWLTHETFDPLFLFHPLVARRDLMKTVIEAGAQGANRSARITWRVFGSQSSASLEGTDTFFLSPFDS